MSCYKFICIYYIPREKRKCNNLF